MYEDSILINRKKNDDTVEKQLTKERQSEENTIKETPGKSSSSLHEAIPNALILFYLVILRVINALTINTFFQPDEYFQSLEPAHQFTYGFGDVTWEWTSNLRSFNYPMIFHICFLLNEYLGFGSLGVVLLPKILQGVISGISEYHLYLFGQKIFYKNKFIPMIMLSLSVMSSFNWFCFTRTFSNTFELNLTMIALSYWPWTFLNTGKQDDFFLTLTKSLIFASLAFFVRPTNIVIWAILGLHLFFSIDNALTRVKISALAIIIGCLATGFNLLIDYYYYGKFVFPLINFLKFNVLTSNADFYGVNSWSFHLIQSLPFILTSYLPFFVYGLFLKGEEFNFKFKKLFLSIIAANIIVLSCIKHKEFRFIYQLMPFLLIFSGFGCYKIYKFSTSGKKSWQIIGKIILFMCLIINLLLSNILTQIQESGVINVIDYLKENPDVDSVGFLMPCHSTPLQSYLHRKDLEFDDRLWGLSCDPPPMSYGDLSIYSAEASKELIANYKDESDYFYEDPKLFLESNLPSLLKKYKSKSKGFKHSWPTHLVFFEALEPFMKTYLRNSNYKECARFFNSYFHWDSRREGDVIVYCKWPWE